MQKYTLGKEELPNAFKLSKYRSVPFMRHALSLCRVAGLRRMAASAELKDLCVGGEDEMERLLALEPGAVRSECCSISARSRELAELGSFPGVRQLVELDLPPSRESAEQAPRAVVGLFKLWILTHVYQRRGA